jgi:uncharacterized protein YlxP (DUF503 family)
MIVGTLELELFLPGASSLKEKRAVLNRAKDRVRARFNAAVAEVGHQELWQRARLGVAVVSHEGSGCRDLLSAIRRSIEQDDRLVIVDDVLDIR